VEELMGKQESVLICGSVVYGSAGANEDQAEESLFG
jgi:hypothetical protein